MIATNSILHKIFFFKMFFENLSYTGEQRKRVSILRNNRNFHNCKQTKDMSNGMKMVTFAPSIPYILYSYTQTTTFLIQENIDPMVIVCMYIHKYVHITEYRE
jgi:hypothetical protein